MFFSTYANNYVCENNYVCYIMLITRGITRKRETLSDYNIRGNIYNMCFLQKSAYIKRSFRLNSLYIQFFFIKNSSHKFISSPCITLIRNIKL